MSGIAGIVLDRQTGPGALDARIRRMILDQRDRGPDRQPSHATDRVAMAMGCARLHITGGFVEGAQPIKDPDGSFLVFNGEIYRHEQVMRDLGITPRRTDSDGVALLAVLAQKGVAGLLRLRGMFAAARYDARTGKVLLVRDAVGKKPLYLRRLEDGWAFASKITSLVAGTGPAELRPDAALEYLIYRSVGGCHSAFQGIEQVPPGGWVEIDPDGTIWQGRWWQLPEVGRLEADEREVEALVDDSVDARVHGNHPAGIFLSGGLDSSIVAACLARRLPGKLRAFAVGYDVPGFEDERDKARGVAKYLSIPIDEVVVHAAQIPDLMAEVAIATEDPIQDPVTLPTLLLSRRAVEYSKVVFTGDGSDEIWGGYERFHDAPNSLSQYLQRTMIFQPADLGRAAAPSSYLDDVIWSSEEPAPLDRIFRLEVQNRMRNYHLARVDKVTMSVGLEARSPFLDMRVVTEGLSIAASAKRPGGRPKGLLTSAFAPVLPDWLVARKKQPFSVPIGAWLKGPLREFALDSLLPSNAFVRQWTDPHRYIRALATDPSAAAKVWSLLQLETWHRSMARLVGAARPSEKAMAA